MIWKPMNLLVLVGLLLLTACGGTSNVGGNPGPGMGDKVDPVITAVNGIVDAATVSGSVSISATATDNTAVTSFTLRIDGSQVASFATGNLSYSWDTTTATNASHSLLFTAGDAAGNTAVRTLNVTVNNNAAPATGTLVGTVLTPDGEDPVSQALLFHVDNSKPDNMGNSDESEPDGSFSLGGIPLGTQDFILRSGIFEESFSFDVQPGQNDIPAGLTTLDAGDASSMLVVTGQYDVIENVLAKLGLGDSDASGNLVLGTEFFTLVDGAGKLDDVAYQDFDDVFMDPANYASYRTIFLNCGNDFETDFFGSSTAVDGLRNWVEAGGRLYCTDWSYDFCEQLWPDMVSFETTDGSGDGLGATAGLANEAELGASQGTVAATIEDAFMLSWLNGRSATNGDGTIDVTDWLPAWTVIQDVDPAVKVWASGDVSFGFPTTTQNRPLTISFNAGNGRVLFSSYHTEEFASSGLTPQDRVLQYLIFEVL